MRYIAILRGINVGTGRKVPMSDLRKLCESMGLQQVQSYIQSGNLIFELPNPEPIPELEARLQKAFSEEFGFEIPVLIRTGEEWAKTISKNPFLGENENDDGRLYLTCLQDEPSPEALKKLDETQYLPDRFKVAGRDVFIMCTSGYGTSKLSNPFFESKLKVTATTRNWKTVMQLNEMAKSKI
jgi:uncharacterized protein (DUF1697 family)